jgi:chondroitin sulfate N-acetylgalactosaminyltransferase 1/2
MFFCDIDIIFNQNFLDLCRFNTRRTEQVYFPILYSFYNPSLSNATSLEELYKRIESPKETSFTASDVGKLNLTINDEIGTWRPSGFGMACLYQEDFESIGGFGDYIAKNVWGGEDLHLFRKFLKSKLSVFRAITPGLFHMYHQKHCDKLKMTEVQFNECMMVKISSEASLKSLGLLHFNNNQF